MAACSEASWRATHTWQSLQRQRAAELATASQKLGHSCTLLPCACFCCGRLRPLDTEGRAAALRALTSSPPARHPHLPQQEAALFNASGLLAPDEWLRSHPVPDWSPSTVIAWSPVWVTNFAETFLNSIIPLLELKRFTPFLRRGEPSLLRPLATARQSRRWFEAMAGGAPDFVRTWHNDSAFTTRYPFYGSRVGPYSTTARSCTQRCSCHHHVVLCAFASTLDASWPGKTWVPTHAWYAAQQIAGILLSKQERRRSRLGSGGGLHSILFVNRTAGRRDEHGGRRLLNLRNLVAQCTSMAVCRARAFGGGGLAADVRAVRETDVLVGMHGAALTHSFFMRPGSSLVEIRPYGFEGAIPSHPNRIPSHTAIRLRWCLRSDTTLGDLLGSGQDWWGLVGSGQAMV